MLSMSLPLPSTILTRNQTREASVEESLCTVPKTNKRDPSGLATTRDDTSDTVRVGTATGCSSVNIRGVKYISGMNSTMKNTSQPRVNRGSLWLPHHD